MQGVLPGALQVKMRSSVVALHSRAAAIEKNWRRCEKW